MWLFLCCNDTEYRALLRFELKHAVRAFGRNIVVPSPLQPHKSGTKYFLPLELHHHSTASNTILKPIISPFHEISSNSPSDCPHLGFKFILNAGALTNLNLLYITLQITCLIPCSETLTILEHSVTDVCRLQFNNNILHLHTSSITSPHLMQFNGVNNTQQRRLYNQSVSQ